jgi:hypothetical protein
MNVENRVVVGGDDARHLCLIQAQIGAARVCPPGIERRAMEVRAVPIVVEPQTEARAAQSEWPHLRVLAVTALRPLLPLLCEVPRDGGM